jgi:hydroxyacylglutathione hydrolase
MTPNLEITTTVVTAYHQNARLLINHDTKEMVILDPGGDIETLLPESILANFIPTAIWLTHCHIDHSGGVQAALARMQTFCGVRPPVLYHSLENPIAKSVPMIARTSGFDPADFQSPPDADIDLKDTPTLSFFNQEIQVLFTPGHSPGHVVFFIPNTNAIPIIINKKPISTPIALVGDTLFRGTIGRTDFPLSDHDTLLNSIKTQLFTLPEETLVLPGHGGPTQVGHEKQTNPFFN